MPDDFFKDLVGFLVNLKTPKGHFEINWPLAEFPIKITYQGSEWQNWLDYSGLYLDVSKIGLFSAEFCFLTHA